MDGDQRRRFLRAVLLALVCAAAPRSLDAAGWIRDVDEAMEIAQANQQPVLLYISMERCGYCQKMIQTTFADAQVRKMLGEGFVPAAMKANERPDLVRRLKIRSFPTTLIVQPSGQVIEQMTGYQDVATFRKKIQPHMKTPVSNELNVAAIPQPEQPPAPVRPSVGAVPSRQPVVRTR